MNIRKASISDDEKLTFFSNFATMLSAGISILEIVSSLEEDSKGNLKKVLAEIKSDLVQGKRLNFSMAKFPNVFDHVTVNIIKASEEAGTLEKTLMDLKDRVRMDIEFKDKIKGALFYPVIILVVFAGILVLMLTFVIPKITSVFSRMNVVLPLPTRIMMYVSDLMLHQTPLFLTGFLSVTGIIVYLFKTQKKQLLNVILSFPAISGLAKDIDLARFSNSLSMLLNSGIPIIYALDLTKDVVNKKEISEAILHVKEKVLAGNKLSDGLKDSRKVIPPIMIRITEAGEKSGALEKSMKDVSEYLDYRVNKSLKAFTTMLEPLMMVVMGVLIGGMMLAIMAPIYGLISQVGA